MRKPANFQARHHARLTSERRRELALVQMDVANRVYGAGFDKSAGFTCDDCESKRHCEYAFDLYNTNGDCLASK